MPSLKAVCDSLVVFITASLNTNNVTAPVQVYTGKAPFEDLTKVLQRLNEAQVVLYPIADLARSATRFPPTWGYNSLPSVPLTSMIVGLVVSFGGSVIPGLNVHVLLNTTGDTASDAYFQTAIGDTIVSCATKAAAAINALSLPGISATSNGAMFTAVGPTSLTVNIGGSTTASRIVRQTMQPIEVRVFAPNGDLRNAIEDIIVSNLGTDVDPGRFIPQSDGTNAWVKYQSHRWMDEMALDTLFESRIWYHVEYCTTQTQTMTQVEATQITVTERAL
jgi:hypothetical protein